MPCSDSGHPRRPGLIVYPHHAVRHPAVFVRRLRLLRQNKDIDDPPPARVNDRDPLAGDVAERFDSFARVRPMVSIGR